MMAEALIREDQETWRMRWVVALRVAIVTFLLGVAIYFQVKGIELAPEISLPYFYIIILLAYIYSIFSLFLINLIRRIRINIYVQSLCDVALITGLVYVTGGFRSIYGVFYPLVIIYTVIFLGRSGGLIIASACSIFYGALLDFEYFGIIQPVYSVSILDYPFSAGTIFLRIIMHILSFYMLAFLASFVVEQEKKTRVLLAEKVSAFDQLDLLHRSIIESVDTGILTIDRRGVIKSFNRAAQEITGYRVAEVENRRIQDLFPGDGDMWDRLSVWNPQEPLQSRIEIPFRKGGTEPLTLGFSASPLKDQEGRRIGDILIFQDLTAIKQMEEAVETNRRLAFIGEMAAGLAHEIRNPLASISGSIQVLGKSILLSDTDRRLMQIILRGKEQLENFMRDFLLLARPQRGGQEPFDLREVIRDILESLPYMPEWSGAVEVIQHLPDRIPMIGSRKEARQLLWNLVVNSIQAMGDGGRLTIEAGQTNEGIEIRIIDTGQGMDEKDLAKAFEPFYTTKERGTGLGLAVVRRIVEGSGGRIRLHSRPGEGTVCVVWLPQTVGGLGDDTPA